MGCPTLLPVFSEETCGIPSVAYLSSLPSFEALPTGQAGEVGWPEDLYGLAPPDTEDPGQPECWRDAWAQLKRTEESCPAPQNVVLGPSAYPVSGTPISATTLILETTHDTARWLRRGLGRAARACARGGRTALQARLKAAQQRGVRAMTRRLRRHLDHLDEVLGAVVLPDPIPLHPLKPLEVAEDPGGQPHPPRLRVVS